MDESIALQNYLAGFHEAVELRLERQRAQCSGKFEALEQRLELESGRLERMRSEIAVEARRAVREAVEKMEQCAEERGGESPTDNDASCADRAGMAKVGAGLRAAAEAVARDMAREATKAACADVAKVQAELAAEAARCREEVQAMATRVQAAEESAATAEAGVKVTESQLEDLKALVADQCPQLEAVEEKAIAGIGNVEVATAALRACLEEAEAKASDTRFGLSSELSYCEDELRSVAEVCHATSGRAESAAQRFTEDAANEFGSELLALRELLQSRMKGIEQHVEDELRSASGACENVEQLWSEMDEAVGAAVKTATSETTTLVSSLKSELSSVREDQHAAVRRGEEAARGMELRVHAELGSQLQAITSRGFGGLEEEVAALQLKARHTSEECLHAARRADSAWRPESAQLAAEVRELRHELASSTKRLHASAKDSAQSLEALSASYGKLTNEMNLLQQQGLSHEWSIAKCMQRLQYLLMDSDAGVWLDSPEFTLGCLGPLVLRLYPHGASRGSAQCAVGLHAPAGAGGRAAVPLRLDLSLAGRSRRAAPAMEEGGGVLWLAEGFGELAELLGEGEDVTVGVEIPTAAWAALEEGPRSQEAAAPPARAAAWAPAPTPRGEGEAAAEPAAAEAALLLGASSAGSSSSRGPLTRPASAGKLSQRRRPSSSSGWAAAVASPAAAPPAAASPGRAGWALFGSDRDGVDLRLSGDEDPHAPALPERERERPRAAERRPPPPPAVADAGAGAGSAGEAPAPAAAPPGTPSGRLRPFASANPWERRPPSSTNPFDS